MFFSVFILLNNHGEISFSMCPKKLHEKKNEMHTNMHIFITIMNGTKSTLILASCPSNCRIRSNKRTRIICLVPELKICVKSCTNFWLFLVLWTPIPLRFLNLTRKSDEQELRTKRVSSKFEQKLFGTKNTIHSLRSFQKRTFKTGSKIVLLCCTAVNLMMNEEGLD